MSTHIPISPAILYWGTPVVLITTANADKTPNIAPMSSAWWLGNHYMLGLDSTSQTTANILRTGECVLNLADDSPAMVGAVNKLAKTTRTDFVPEAKRGRGYVHEKDKFGVAGLTPLESGYVKPPAIMECKVVMEARLVAAHNMFPGTVIEGGAMAEVEVGGD